MPPIEFKAKRWKLALLLLLGIGFVAVGFWMVRDYSRTHALREIFGGGLSILFFTPISLIILRRLFSNQPDVILSDEGLYVRGQSADPIPWQTIVAASIAQVQRSRFITIEVEDPSALTATASPWRRLIVKMNSGMGYGHINISMTALGIQPEALLALIEERVAAARSQRSHPLQTDARFGGGWSSR